MLNVTFSVRVSNIYALTRVVLHSKVLEDLVQLFQAPHLSLTLGAEHRHSTDGHLALGAHLQQSLTLVLGRD